MANKKIFFNYAAVGPIEKSAYIAAKNFLDDYIAIGPPEVLEKYSAYPSMLSAEIAKLLNCSKEEIVYTKNTTEGMIIASECLPLEKGQEVLLMENEYPANIIAWLKKKKDGLDVKFIGGESNEDAYKNLFSAITPKTKAICVSWGQYYDGYLPDLKALSRVCLKNGTFLVIDGVHGVGTKKIDMQEVGIDVMTCGGQKHIGSLGGIGFLYVNKKNFRKLKDFKPGIRSVEYYSKEGYKLKNSSERFQDGTQNLAGIVSLYAAIKKINNFGMDKIERKNNFLMESYKRILKDNNIPFIGYENQASIISLPVSNPESLVAFLRRSNIHIKAVKNAARFSFSHKANINDFKFAIKFVQKWMEMNSLSVNSQKFKKSLIALEH